MMNPARAVYSEAPRWVRKLPLISLGVLVLLGPVGGWLVVPEVRSTMAVAEKHRHWTEGLNVGTAKAQHDHLYFQLPSESSAHDFADVCCPPLSGEDRKEWTDGFVSGYAAVHEREGGPSKKAGKPPVPPILNRPVPPQLTLE